MPRPAYCAAREARLKARDWAAVVPSQKRTMTPRIPQEPMPAMARMNVSATPLTKNPYRARAKAANEAATRP